MTNSWEMACGGEGVACTGVGVACCAGTGICCGCGFCDWTLAEGAVVPILTPVQMRENRLT